MIATGEFYETPVLWKTPAFPTITNRVLFNVEPGRAIVKTGVSLK